MGSVFRQRGRRIWMIQYYKHGVPMVESSGAEDKTQAKRLLKTREADIVRGVPISPKVGRLRFEEAAQDIINDYKVNGRRSLDELERRIRLHLAPVFRERRLAAITTPDVRAYITARQEAGASAGEINRELTALKRMFTLAVQAGKLLYRPHIPLLKERNVRTGFFELETFLAVRAKLPAPLQPVVTFAYIAGWRIADEVLPLEWRRVDLSAGEIRLDRGTTKNDEGRVFPITDDLRALFVEQRQERDRLLREKGLLCPYVFHRDGKPIKRFEKAWKAACVAAGCPGRIPHDFRRTAVRNMVRSGVPERVAMELTGHKTRSVFERYNIVSPGDFDVAKTRLSGQLTRPASRRTARER